MAHKCKANLGGERQSRVGNILSLQAMFGIMKMWFDISGSLSLGYLGTDVDKTGIVPHKMARFLSHGST